MLSTKGGQFLYAYLIILSLAALLLIEGCAPKLPYMPG